MMVSFEDMHGKIIYVNSKTVEMAQTRDHGYPDGSVDHRVELSLASGHQVYVRGIIHDVVKRLF